MSGPYGDEREPPSGQDDARARICVSSGWSSPACDGPVWALDRDGSLGLAIPSADGSVRLLPGLALVSEGGTEEESSIEHADVRASPIEAFVELSEAEQSCEGEEGDETCGMSEARRRVVAVRELDGGAFVEVEIVVSPAQVRDDEPDPPPLEPPTLVVHGGEVTVHACGGARTFPLPADDTVDAGLDAGVDAGAPVPVPSETDVDAAIARCNVGWQHFGADEMDAARSDVEGGLVVLERADDERGRRARGACLYNLGRIEEAAGHTTEALALYRRSVAVRPNAAVQTRVESLGE
jgi:hypothetical protein